VLRKGYFRLFKQNLYKGDENRLAMFTKGDLKPFIIDQGNTITTLVKQVAKKLLRRVK
jgi:hypothetical protein